MRYFFDIEADECVSDSQLQDIFEILKQNGEVDSANYSNFLEERLEEETSLVEVSLTDDKVKEVAGKMLDEICQNSSSGNWSFSRDEIEKIAGCTLKDWDLTRIENALWANDEMVAAVETDPDCGEMDITIYTSFLADCEDEDDDEDCEDEDEDEDEDDISEYDSSDSDSDIVKDVVMGFFFG